MPGERERTACPQALFPKKINSDLPTYVCPLTSLDFHPPPTPYPLPPPPSSFQHSETPLPIMQTPPSLETFFFFFVVPAIALT